jgi:hypothetical protein
LSPDPEGGDTKWTARFGPGYTGTILYNPKEQVASVSLKLADPTGKASAEAGVDTEKRLSLTLTLGEGSPSMEPADVETKIREAEGALRQLAGSLPDAVHPDRLAEAIADEDPEPVISSTMDKIVQGGKAVADRVVTLPKKPSKLVQGTVTFDPQFGISVNLKFKILF